MTLSSIIVALIVGLISGWLAGVLVHGRGFGVLVDILVGILGAFVGGFVFHTLITLTLGIWWFQILVPLYVVFLDPDEVYRRFALYFPHAYPCIPVPRHADRG